MPNPIKAIKGGVQNVKNLNTLVKVNNQAVKAGTTVTPRNAKPLAKKTIGPKDVARSFALGVKDPKGAKAEAQELKVYKASQKK